MFGYDYSNEDETCDRRGNNRCRNCDCDCEDDNPNPGLDAMNSAVGGIIQMSAGLAMTGVVLDAMDGGLFDG